ncbi:MAG: anhydro-N-acetylmuramic acid kinase [Rhodospirillales bacterium]|nr:anhydro-N-acetylmuramic acid kinase [Rhodospirillales bacterium]
MSGAPLQDRGIAALHEVRALTALGLMSGTSLDGVDAALLVTDGEHILERGAWASFPYAVAFRERLRGLLGREQRPGDEAVVRDLTLLHAEAVARLLDQAGLAASDVDVIGFHGQTVMHRPEIRLTRQIGDGRRLAVETGVPVVEDFRSADVATGGHGAPLAPLYHLALAERLERPLAVLNIGGVANVTWMGADEGSGAPPVLAFDTGTGNALIDDWVRQTTGRAWDEGGRIAAVGRIDDHRLRPWLDDPYFRAAPPKSLDRDHFAGVLATLHGMDAADGAATLAAFTVRAVQAALAHMPEPPRRWLVCGGGRHNGVLMAMLADAVAAPVDPVEAVGWNGDALEAQAFAFLAVRSLQSRPLSLPTTTGVPRPLTGGTLRLPSMS